MRNIFLERLIHWHQRDLESRKSMTNEPTMKLTDFDYLIGDHHLQLVKAAIPYVPVTGQRFLSLFVKLRELQRTVSLFREEPVGAMGICSPGDGQKGSPLEIMKAINMTGRDNARTPMQWDDSEHAGFTSGTPWIAVNPNYKTINAKLELVDKNSVFHYYKKLIALRKSEEWGELLAEGDYEPFLEEDPDLFMYLRSYGNKKLLVMGNFHGEERTVALPIKIADIVLSNYPEPHRWDGWIVLRPYEAMMAEVSPA